jgi:WD40 repeat protein
MRGHEADILALAVSPDGRRAATGDKDGQIIVWDLERGQPTHALWAAVAVHALRFDGDALEGLDQDNLRWRWSLKDTPPLTTNYRVCRATGAVVPITPYPAEDTVWADESACR